MAAGSAFACSGLRWTPLPSWAVTPGGGSASWPASRVAKIAPKIAAPKKRADRTEEGGSGGGSPGVTRANIIMDDQASLHHESDSDPHDEHGDGRNPGAVGSRKQGERVHADDQGRCAGDGEKRCSGRCG